MLDSTKMNTSLIIIIYYQETARFHVIEADAELMFPADMKPNSTSTKYMENGDKDDAATFLISKVGWGMNSY